MKIDELSLWEAFQGVAIQKSFSKAAKILRVGAPQLSKRINKLESQLGVRLFTRSTRQVALTDEGQSLLPKVNSILEDLQGLETSFESKQRIEGTVRITCVPFIAHRFLLPLLKNFMKRHPDVQIDLELSEGFVNLVESNTDLAIRIDDGPSDSSLVYRKLAPNQLILCASPGYLKKAKAPLQRPSDLKRHDVLMLDVHSGCRFEKGSQTLGEFVKDERIACNNGWFLTELALQNFGVLVRSELDVQVHLKSGALVQVMKNHPIEAFGNIYAVIPSRRYLAPRVRALMDFISASPWH